MGVKFVVSFKFAVNLEVICFMKKQREGLENDRFGFFFMVPSELLGNSRFHLTLCNLQPSMD